MDSRQLVDSITLDDAGTLLSIARTALSSILGSGTFSYPAVPSDKLQGSCGVFITYRDASGNVRGSMGLLGTDRPLYLAVVDCAVAAARDDPRYRRLRADDAQSVAIELTLIKGVEDITGRTDVAAKTFKSGVHGLYVEGDVRASVMLPREIAGRGMTFESALEALKERVGAGGSQPVKCYMFECRVFVQPSAGSAAVELT